jgi:cyclase
MSKKRVIFTLLFDGSDFVLSRNFRLQKVGNLDWLRKNYQFEKTARSIDELIVLNVCRSESSINDFAQALKTITFGCFVPVTAGGGVRSLEDATLLLRSGADKIVLNTLLHTDPEIVTRIAQKFGKQCVVASIDILKLEDAGYKLFYENGATLSQFDAQSVLSQICESPVGEIYLNSINQDGTGNGYDLGMLDLLPDSCSKPVIVAGGVGNFTHLDEGLKDSRVSAVATAHLFNFVGNGLESARNKLSALGHEFPKWNYPMDLHEIDGRDK